MNPAGPKQPQDNSNAPMSPTGAKRPYRNASTSTLRQPK